MSSLPIYSVLPDLQEALINSNQVILQAPPGAGKTTTVPLALLNADWLKDRKIIMLEPRRLAARSSAMRMAELLGERVGETVGYQVKGDSCISESTRIQVLTEGILTRKLQSDPELNDVAIVIFDEFHERSLQADLSLAFCLQSQEVLREDLKLLIMSATLNTQALSSQLADAPVICSEGRSFPVENIFWPEQSAKIDKYNITSHISHLLQKLLKQELGNVLIFLPGVGEIKKLEAELKQLQLNDTIIAPLYGNLSKADQDQAISAPAKGQRKVVLATNIAETSITIDGITLVIDSGLMRENQFNPNSGMDQLVTRFISRDSAEQRSGRAGRLSPGKCYRLWTESQHKQFQQHHTPEILNSDLAPLVLEAAHWGALSVDEFQWIDSPPKGSIAQAIDLLTQLDAVQYPMTITPHGKSILQLGLHPRLGHMLIKSVELGLQKDACLLAALLSERDILTKSANRSADISQRLSILRQGSSGPHINSSACKLIKQQAKQLEQKLNQLHKAQGSQRNHSDMTGVLLAYAYPERIGKLRNSKEHRYILSGGRGAAFNYNDELASNNFIVVAQLDGKQREATIYTAAAISEEEIETYFSAHISTQKNVHWDPKQQRVIAEETTRLGEIALSKKPLHNVDISLIHQGLMQGIRDKGINCLPWDKKSTKLKSRIEFINKLKAHRSDDYNDLIDNLNLPNLSDGYLLENLESWLLPHLNKENSLDKLQQLSLADILLSQLSWEQQKLLDEITPSHFLVPSGSRIEINYDEEIPVLAVRLQEMFGLQQTPSILKGRYPLLIHLLSPAHRPMQITKDLNSFWKNTYQDVKKELKIKYKKHYWPDNPLEAQATSRTKKNMHKG